MINLNEQYPLRHLNPIKKISTHILFHISNRDGSGRYISDHYIISVNGVALSKRVLGVFPMEIIHIRIHGEWQSGCVLCYISRS